MPPAISDEEASDHGELTVSLTSKRTKRASTKIEENDDDEMQDIVKADVENGDDNQDDEGDEEEVAEDLDEDEFIVEKILGHVVEPDGALKFKVKWEGYEKKSDQTWEDDENLKENASDVLEEYLRSVGGREQIMDDAKTALKTKKRGRPASGTPTNGTKRRRNGDHPDSATPPASGKGWRVPVGSWEDEVESIDACHDENTGKLIVYLTWKNGQKTQHDTKVVYQRCPQKMLQFYERHVKIVMSSESGLKDE
ncbi:heterochromatin protein one [Annulohypoxylon maeteangense]|uniref:heterochromatin protein one n=1 Tax=Annulohypoxylon maeteangense TaxID=1927788 RepID=UPI0020073F3A|nr:heterochromatin protein one [Annulohypoxylon maeteangense]KAI0888445.1 heterochromatin protein one [Annulohypoxylon maeteangense]